MKELVKASVKVEVCHNNIIIEHRSFRWIELNGYRKSTTGRSSKLVVGVCSLLQNLSNYKTIQFAVNRRNSGIRKAPSTISLRQTTDDLIYKICKTNLYQVKVERFRSSS